MVMLFVFDSVEFVREQVFVAEDESGACEKTSPIVFVRCFLANHDYLPRQAQDRLKNRNLKTRGPLCSAGRAVELAGKYMMVFVCFSISLTQVLGAYVGVVVVFPWCANTRLSRCNKPLSRQIHHVILNTKSRLDGCAAQVGGAAGAGVGMV